MHLEEIAFHVAPGAHAVLLLDQAGWHGSAELVVPPNITLMPLPPRCPELNPVENVWQFMRDNWLSNRIFKSYDDIVDHCCFAWNKLVDQPWRIMSIGMRHWAHGYSSMHLGISANLLSSYGQGGPCRQRQGCPALHRHAQRG
jgi:hypothetical protein